MIFDFWDDHSSVMWYRLLSIVRRDFKHFCCLEVWIAFLQILTHDFVSTINHLCWILCNLSMETGFNRDLSLFCWSTFLPQYSSCHQSCHDQFYEYNRFSQGRFSFAILICNFIQLLISLSVDTSHGLFFFKSKSGCEFTFPECNV